MKRQYLGTNGLKEPISNNPMIKVAISEEIDDSGNEGEATSGIPNLHLEEENATTPTQFNHWNGRPNAMNLLHDFNKQYINSK
jgi:hypothetical protein